jgi:hypothetical protein
VYISYLLLRATRPIHLLLLYSISPILYSEELTSYEDPHYVIFYHTPIGFNGNFLRFRRDGVSISYTVICLSHFDVCLAIT